MHAVSTGRQYKVQIPVQLLLHAVVRLRRVHSRDGSIVNGFLVGRALLVGIGSSLCKLENPKKSPHIRKIRHQLYSFDCNPEYSNRITAVDDTRRLSLLLSSHCGITYMSHQYATQPLKVQQVLTKLKMNSCFP